MFIIFTSAFQNCGTTRLMNESLNTQSISSIYYLLNDTSLPSVNYIGNITTRYSTESDTKDQFSLNQEVILELTDSHSDAHSYEWIIIRGFDVIVDQVATTGANYSHTFTQKGVHDIIALSYAEENTSDVISWAGKRIVIGEECDPSHIMEFNLTKGHLTKGDNSISFEIVSDKSTSTPSWHIKSEEFSFQQNTETMTISLTSETESIFIEAFGSDSDANECLTYRVRNDMVNANNTPYINSVRPVNENDPVTLENNDIYKYKRASQTKLEVDVVDADQCQWNDTTVDCEGGTINIISEDDQDTTLCTDSQEVLKISYTQSDETVSDEKQYYKYCPPNKDFCYFGPILSRPNTHHCETIRTLAADKENFNPTPVDGVCDNTVRNGCTSGVFQDADDSETQHLWYCTGLGGGTTGDCSKPADAECNNSIKNRCFYGILEDVSDTQTQYIWHCISLEAQKNTDICSKPADGQCNNDAQNACSYGIANDSAIADTNTHYRWYCEGKDEGSTATNCQKEKPPVSGACNNAVQNGCTSGTANDSAIADTSTHYQWHCEGLNGGTTAKNCQKVKPVNGVCNNTIKNGCTSGTANNSAIADTNTHYQWHCEGKNEGSTATNCQKVKPVNGVCNNTIKDGCTSGTANDSAIADTNTHHRWHCEGKNGGSTATNCQKVKPTVVNGVCDNTVRNGCTSGVFQDADDKETQHLWYCTGLGGGTTGDCSKPADAECNNSIKNRCFYGTLEDVSDTQTQYIWHCISLEAQKNTDICSKPADGQCNNDAQNACSYGIANDSAIADTNTHYRWYCEGKDGGSTATNCQKAKIPVNGACNNDVQNGCTSGTANDSAITDISTHYLWHCEGKNGGSTATNCQKAKTPVNGACNNDVQNGCTFGTANDSAIADTNTHYQWHCEGKNGGSTATNCQKAKSAAVNGVCNNSQRNGCTSGTANDLAVADTNTHYQWHCEGKNGGSTATNCQRAKATPVNGVCNNTIKDGCTSGTANDSAIADTNTHYRWHCEGKNGGTTATNCQKAKPVNGVCNNSQRNACTSGTANDLAVADTNTHYRWSCIGRNGGTTASNCQKAKPVNGVCNNSQRNACSAGTANDSAITDTNTHYRWHCEGLHGGNTATNCQKAKPTPVNGVCNNTIKNGCTSGTANDSAIADTSTHYLWHCEGKNGGSTATNCQRAKATPVDGVCNNSQRNACSAGTANDSAITDTNTHYRWHCEGKNGGSTATNCQKTKPTPVNGVCNNSQRNGCTSGTANDLAIADTNTHYQWHCEGKNGGSTATNCQKAKSVNGICNNLIKNGCASGTANDSAIADTSTHYLWHCEGKNGGSTATNCQIIKAITGICDNRSRNSCKSGTPYDSFIADTNTHYQWYCVGSNGGTTATNCQKVKPVNGVCNNSQRNGCTSGTANDLAVADTNTHYQWHCVGKNGGSTATNCQKAKTPVNGVCDNTVRNGCTSGTLKDFLLPDGTVNNSFIADTNTHYRWHCEGSNGGTTATNCEMAKVINGRCYNIRRNGCASGTANDSALADTNDHYRWHCVGSNGGTTAKNCEMAKVIKGRCNNRRRNGCVSGTTNDSAIADTSTHYRWHCEGLGGGSTATNCQIIKAITGICDNRSRNSCKSGTPYDSFIADTNTHYRWHCVGSNGGTTATNCQKAKPVDR